MSIGKWYVTPLTLANRQVDDHEKTALADQLKASSQKPVESETFFKVSAFSYSRSTISYDMPGRFRTSPRPCRETESIPTQWQSISPGFRTTEPYSCRVLGESRSRFRGVFTLVPSLTL